MIDFQETESQQRARQVMGRNFLGIPEVLQAVGKATTDDYKRSLEDVPYSPKVLRQSARTHLLVAGIPFTIRQLHETVCSHLFNKTIGWYIEEDPPSQFYANESVPLSWILLRKRPLPGSFELAWKDQLRLLNESEYVPHACEVVYATLLYYSVRGRKLFELDNVRCVDYRFQIPPACSPETSPHCRLSVGNSMSEEECGLEIFVSPEDSRCGLAVARQPDLMAR